MMRFVPLRACCRSAQPAARAFTTSGAGSEKVDVCVIGGGVVGCSVAYHAAPDASVLLLDQARFGGGTTWHAAGLVGQLRSSKAETLTSGVYASKLYRELEESTGLSCGYKDVGSVTLARTAERMEQHRRTASRARSYGLDVREISVDEANERTSGVMSLHDVVGALWIPGDGAVDASNVCAALAKGARARGAELREHQQVRAVERDGSGWRVCIEGKPDVLCKRVINCAGQWARQLARLSNIEVPLHSCEHFYVVSRPSPELQVPSSLPIVRDQDGFMYAREWSGGLMVGTFELNAKAAFLQGVPDDFEFSLLPDDWDHFMPYMEDILARFPKLQDARWDMTNGPESFTFDNVPCAGEVPGSPGYFVAAGMCSAGIASAPGIGRLIAEWLRTGGPPSSAVGHSDLWRVPEFTSQSYCRRKSEEALGMHYMLRLPKQESETCRGLRRSPLFGTLKQHGARFGTKAGWERPNFFAERTSAKPRYGFQDAEWIEHQLAEHLRCREGAALFDTTSFAKTLVVGPEAELGLSWLCANEIRGRRGFATYTQMLNERGGIEADVTVRELDENRWLVLSPTASGLRDRCWMEARLPAGAQCIDVTAQYAVLALQGPKSLDVLCAASGASHKELLGMSVNQARKLDLGFVMIDAVRTSYVGESLGWELICTTDLAQYVYDELRSFGAEDAGYLAIDSLRMERGRVAWGHELSPSETPLEAGLAFAVKRGKKGGFLGREALQATKPQRRLCLLSLPAGSAGELHSSIAWGGEPVVVAGEYTGEQVTSACLCPKRQLDGSLLVDNLAMAYLEDPEAETMLEVAGKRLPATVARLPLRG